MTFNFKSFSPFCLLCTDRMYRIPLIIKKSPFEKHIQNINIYKLTTFFCMSPNIISRVLMSTCWTSFFSGEMLFTVCVQCYIHFCPKHRIISNTTWRKQASSPIETQMGFKELQEFTVTSTDCQLCKLRVVEYCFKVSQSAWAVITKYPRLVVYGNTNLFLQFWRLKVGGQDASRVQFW